MKNGLIALLVILCTQVNFGQSIQLSEILDIANNQSWGVKDAEQKLESASLNYALFKTQLKPFIGLDAALPNYIQSSNPITQPNGTVSFQRLSQNNSRFSLYAIQQIASTGGQLFLQSNLTRFDDFTFDNKLYNGIPIRIGINQPIFGIKPLKWQKKTQPLLFNEAEKQKAMSIELNQLQAVNLYFSTLSAAEDLKIAKFNSETNQGLLSIAEERLNLGKISTDEKLQLEIELKNAQLDVENAEFRFMAGRQNLAVFLNYELSGYTDFINDYELREIYIDEKIALESAKRYRPEMVAFQRNLIEAQQNVSNTKINNGPQLNLFASFGLARGSQELSEIYLNPFTEQQVSLQVSLPIIDWGKRKISVKQAILQQSNQQSSAEQEIRNLENIIIQKIREFRQNQENLKAQEEITSLSNERFKIANERYELGAIDITNFTLAQRDKNNNQRNSTLAISNYWISYFELRVLTGYDFLNQKPIF